jgi:integrase
MSSRAEIHLAEPVIVAMKEMLAHFEAEDEKAKRAGRPVKLRPGLFGSRDRNLAARAFRNAAKRAGVPAFGPHKLGRHTFAAQILDAGMSLPALKRAGRWKSLRAVERYAHLEQDEIDDAVRTIGARSAKRWKRGKP